MALRTKLTERLRICHPILLDPAGATVSRIVAEDGAALARRFG